MSSITLCLAALASVSSKLPRSSTSQLSTDRPCASYSKHYTELEVDRQTNVTFQPDKVPPRTVV